MILIAGQGRVTRLCKQGRPGPGQGGLMVEKFDG